VLARQADGRYVVRSRHVRGLTAGVLVVFFLLDAGGVIDATNTAALVFAMVLEVALAALVVRAWRSATMIVSETEVVVRSLLTTRSWPRDKVRAFVASTRRVGMGGWRRRVLGIVFVDGSTRWLTEINSRPPREGAPTWIDEAVSALNEPQGR
jgi:hypothetical protein